MAWLEKHPTSGRFKICFRWGGRKLKKTVKITAQKDAEAALARFEENLVLLERGRLEAPPGADIGTFLLSDGKLTAKAGSTTCKALTFRDLQDAYLDVHGNGALEDNSLDTIRTHLRHLAATLGETFVIQSLEGSHLQRHIDRRANKHYRGKRLSAATLKKEIASLRACWNWAVQASKLQGVFPNRGLRFPKTDDKPPFQTRTEIERQIARGGLTKVQTRELWECLVLTRTEVDQLLHDVRVHAAQSFLYPMVCLAAHTGARRSELLRLKIDDVDFQSGTVLLHEKKRVRGRRSSRRVPLSARAQAVVREWLTIHPGGQFLFCQAEVVRSKTHRQEPIPLTRDEAHDHFKRTLTNSNWSVVRGWHTLRHSFASNCATTGIDQRFIDEWMGHQTEEMVRRYRHLFPDQQRKAIDAVFA